MLTSEFPAISLPFLFLCYYRIEENRTARWVSECGISIATRITPCFNTMWISPGNYSALSYYGGINNINFNGNKVTWYSQEYTDNRVTAEKTIQSPPDTRDNI